MNKKQINEIQEPKTRNVLLVKVNRNYTYLLQDILNKVGDSLFYVECVNHLSEVETIE